MKWNTPLTFAKQIFHSEAISQCDSIISHAESVFRWKKHQSCIKIDAFFWCRWWEGTNKLFPVLVDRKQAFSTRLTPQSLKTLIKHFLNGFVPSQGSIPLYKKINNHQKMIVYFWCRWWESNPHGITTTGFWVQRVCQFHHTCISLTNGIIS